MFAGKNSFFEKYWTVAMASAWIPRGVGAPLSPPRLFLAVWKMVGWETLVHSFD
jgi:hypothetical protein